MTPSDAAAAAAQAVEVVEVAAVRLGALAGQGGRALVGAGQAGDLVPGCRGVR